jgi:hypothetical protein
MFMVERNKAAMLKSRDFTGFFHSVSFTPSGRGGIIMKENLHLDNSISALPSVQTCTHVPACKVTLVFPKASNPTVRREIATLLYAAYQSKQGSNEHG